MRAVREPVRLHLLAVREGLDPRQRGFNKTARAFVHGRQTLPSHLLASPLQRYLRGDTCTSEIPPRRLRHTSDTPLETPSKFRATRPQALGKRVQMERRLIGTSATLIIVPSSLLEHWHEQLCR